ncbi:MAG: HAD family hydrolase [Methyloceanibacter sp.]|uniref:HAD family hydrolase n=1 Tax=Methyloceanibacter sp. TaxID=1965321 RepID=UPI003D6CB092
MAQELGIIFLFDVDDTLLDNDRFKGDLGRYVLSTFGKEANDRLWAIYEEERVKHGYADFLGTLERFRLEHIHNQEVLRLATWVVDYPFADCLYPDALAVVRHVSQWGLPVILTDGDGVFQPHKLERSGLYGAFGGHVLNYVHKENELDAVQRAYPARHYVLIDDKLSLLNAVKRAWGNRVTTVFAKQGHYANDAQAVAKEAPADIAIAHIADLMTHDFSALAPA